MKENGVKAKVSRVGMSAYDIRTLDRQRKVVADPKARKVKDFYRIDTQKLTEWGNGSSFWCRSRAFYFNVANKTLASLTERQTTWLEDISVKLQSNDPGPGMVKVWTKEEIEAKYGKKQEA